MTFAFSQVSLKAREINSQGVVQTPGQQEERISESTSLTPQISFRGTMPPPCSLAELEKLTNCAAKLDDAISMTVACSPRNSLRTREHVFQLYIPSAEHTARLNNHLINACIMD